MRLKSILLIIIILGSLCSYGLTIIRKDTLSHSTQNSGYIDNIEILLGLATKVYFLQPERSLQYAETAIGIAKKHKDKLSEANALRVIGDVYRKLDYDRLSLPYYNRALELAQKVINLKLESELQIAIGDVFYKLNKNDSAFQYYQKSLDIAQKTGDQIGIANSTLKIGNVYWYRTNYDKALDQYLKSLNIYELQKHKKGIAKVYNNIGSLYTVLGDYKNSILYLKKSLQYFADFDDAESLSELYFRLGNTHAKMCNYDTALLYLDLSKSIFDSLHFERKLAYVDQSKGNIYYQKGNTSKAIEIALSAYERFKKFEYTWGAIETSNDLGKYYMKLNDFTKSKFYLDQALINATKVKSWELLKQTYLELSNLYNLKQDYKKSLDFYRKYQVVNDSVSNHEKTTRITELQAKYETDKKEQEIKRKNVEINKNIELIKRQQFHLYLFGIGIAIILLLSFILFRQYKLLEIKGKKIERINEELDLRVKERTSALRLTQFSIEHAADPIFWIDSRGRFVYANNSACVNLIYSKEEILRKTITDIIPKFSISDWKDFWEITKKEGSLVVETSFIRKSNSEFPVELILNYIYHEQKEYAFAFMRDISDRKQKEENLKKAKEKAEEADKLKSAFLANMSHEIRTPMNAIIGFSDMLLHEDFTSEEKQEFANIIKTSGDTLLKLIDDIIDVSIIEAGQLKINKSSYYLNALLKEIHLFFMGEKKRLNKDQIELKLADLNFDDQIVIHVDQVRFRQVLTNLLGNALKFTESGCIEIGYYIQKNKSINIYVKDTGIGIPPNKISTIFERFNKHIDDKKLYGGTGLGLTISKKLAEQMDGTLTVESSPGQGSIFMFTLPYSYSLPPQIKIEKKLNATNGKYDWRKKSILVVEDVASNYLLLETTLKKTGANVYWAKDGLEALDYCTQSRPDAILMDIQLPNLSGYDVTKEILKMHPTIPIIAQTAYAFNDEKEKILEAGCVDCLTKPIISEVLYETVNRHLV